MESLMKILKEEHLSCIVSQNNHIYKEKADGIRPILTLLDKGVLKDAQIADKVIGKAAAMMLVFGGIKEVHAGVILSLIHILMIFLCPSCFYNSLSRQRTHFVQ